VSEFDQLREEVDDLRGRVAYMQHQQEVVNLSAARADKAAQAADRQLARSRSEWREVVNDLEAGMSQVISLLTSATCLPARRPENTQSASDSPLT
jgi:hypothetical protein